MSKQTTSKKQQFTQPQKSKAPLIMVAVAIVVFAAVAMVMLKSGQEAQGEYFGEPVAATRSYVGKFVSMTRVEPEISGGKIQIPLSVVDEKNIVYFEIENNEGVMVPLMAYITPSGRLFAGSSMCEPCRGRTFSLAGETLFCDTCRTTYTIEDHKFISGAVACGSYPPVNMNGVVENGIINIELEEVLNWRIRTL
ncbi:MAG: DUF2318 domain-containing protein [Dethiobacter sp.]|jgi:hypothetical protein|nr:DUF2318 domain-containing protein [Dethiobacter sp.]